MVDLDEFIKSSFIVRCALLLLEYLVWGRDLGSRGDLGPFKLVARSGIFALRSQVCISSLLRISWAVAMHDYPGLVQRKALRVHGVCGSVVRMI